MIKEWQIPVSFNKKDQLLRSTLEYESAQILRIRVYGSRSSILLETNYPFLYHTNSRAGITWKLKEGSFSESNVETSRLLTRIMSELEKILKQTYPFL